MTKNDTHIITPKTTEERTAKSAKSKNYRYLFPTLLSILAFLLALVAAFFAWQARDKNQQSHALTITQLSRLKQQLNQTQDQQQTKQTQNQQIQQQLDELTKQLKTLETQDNPNQLQQEWSFIQIKHYLELAQINAHWNNDKQAAIFWLQQADRLLANTSAQEMYALRQTLAQEINTLKSIPTVDFAGILSQLDAISKQVDALPLRPTGQSTETTPSNNQTAGWRAQWDNSVRLLKKLVIVKHHDKGVPPLLFAEQQDIVRDLTKLILRETQWAVLKQDQAIFDQTLAQAQQEIKEYFDATSPATQEVLKTLAHLATTKLQTQLPDISQALQQLNDYLSHQQPTPAPAQGEANP